MGAPRLIIAVVVGVIDLLASTASGWAQSPNWSGFYLGGAAGYYVGQNKWQINAPPNPINESMNFSGWVYGGQLGYLTQEGGLVYGGELSILGGSPKGTMTCSAVGTLCQNDLDYLASLSGRLGVPIGNFLPYVTAGFAELRMGALRVERVGPASGGVVDVLTGSGTHNGVSIGGGVDYALNSVVSVGIDARYFLFEGKEYSLTGAILQENAKIRPDPEVIMMRLSIRFGESPYASKPKHAGGQ
jgi:outer membrane immunogenic protein